MIIDLILFFNSKNPICIIIIDIKCLCARSLYSQCKNTTLPSKYVYYVCQFFIYARKYMRM